MGQSGAWKLVEEDVVDIKRLIRKGLKDQQIADKFNVSREHIWKIRHNERWGWVDTPPVRSNDFRDFGGSNYKPKRDKQIDYITIHYTDGTELDLR